MRHARSIFIVAAIGSTLLTWLYLFQDPGSASAAASSLLILSLSPVVSPTPSSTPVSTPSSPALDPTVVVALIGLVGAIVAAVIAGLFALYQIRRTAHVEQRRQEEQFQHDQEMARLQKELELQYKTKEQEQQRQEQQAEAIRSTQLQATTIAERVQAYRQALHADPRIARLQILDMNRPLMVTDIYIRVRLHQETRPGYEDPTLLDAQMRRDPNALLKAGQLRLASRSSAALEPHEAIRTYQHCVIVGDPGAGKTTLLKYLTLQSVDHQLANLPDLPIHIELNAFASSGHRDLLEFASSVWEERYGFPKTDALAHIQDSLQHGKAILLLDALDETMAGTTKEQAEESYTHATKAITDLATRYHQSPIVVTARKAGYHQRARLGGFTELEVLDFRPEDITQFVNRWFACHPNPRKRANAADLNTRLERSPRIQALAANPLLLSLIVIVYEDQLDLPDRRAELYRQCVETLLTRWDASREIRRRREFKPEHKRQLLEQVAWHFHLQGQRYFPENELLDVIATFLPTIGLPAEQNGQVLDEIVAENGLLKEQARGWHGFLHLTLQEYFAAQYAVDHHQLDTLLDHRGDPWWEEVLSLYAGRIPDASPLLERLLEPGSSPRLREDLFQTNLLVAGECLAARPTVQRVSLRASVIDRLFTSLVTAPYAFTRQQMAELLAKIGGTEVNTRLLRLLADEQMNPNVRRRIASALGKLGERTVIPDLLRLLADVQVDGSVRPNIARALGELGERSVIPDLLRLLADVQVDGSVRMSIAGALGVLGERSVIPDLLHLLADEQVDQGVRVSIAFTLGGLGERSVAPDLLRLLADEQVDQGMRVSIALALSRVGERSVAPDLLRLLADEQVDKYLRGNIASALGELGERSVIPDLLRLLADEQMDKYVCKDIAQALGKLGERSVIPDLLRLLADEQVDQGVRGNIAQALSELGERSVIPELLRLLADEQVDQVARWKIPIALGELGERTVIPELLRLLADEQVDQGVRSNIAEAIAKLADSEQDARTLATLLPTSDVAESIYRALWTVSRRAGVRVFKGDGSEGKRLEVVTWLSFV